MNKFNKFLEYAFTNKYYKPLNIKDLTIKIGHNGWGYYTASFIHEGEEIYSKGIQSKKKRLQVSSLIDQFNTSPSEEIFNKICNLIKADTARLLRTRRILSRLSDEGKAVVKEKLTKLEEAYPDVLPSLLKLQQDLKDIKEKMIKVKHLVSEGEDFVKLGEVPSSIQRVDHGFKELSYICSYSEALSNYIEKLKKCI